MNDTISIFRWTDSKGNSRVSIVIRNDRNKIVYRGDIGLEDFAKCITGMESIPLIRDDELFEAFSVDEEGATK